MEEINLFLQIVLSIVLGGILGWQRERWAKPAGIRTYAFVTAGSTLFTILSLHGFGAESPSRVAAQVAVGIGFIGAGTIIHKDNHTEGLTTAAGLWISSAIGMAVAVEYYLLAVLCTLVVLGLLVADEKRHLFNNVDPHLAQITVKKTKPINRPAEKNSPH